MATLKRDWNVLLIPHTHTDIGYTDDQPVVFEKHLSFLDEVVELSHQTDAFPEEAQFRWTCEVTWQIVHYLRHRSESQRTKLLDLILAGRIEVTAMYLNFTELLDLQCLIRSCYPGARLRDEFGVPLRSAMCSDVNGLPWGFAKVLPALGVDFLNVASNPTRALPRHPPRFFWWEGSDGRRMLVWDGPSYFLANLLGFGQHTRPFPEGLTSYLAELEEKNYPHNAIGLRVQGILGDNSPPTRDVCDQVRDWNSQGNGPRLQLCTNRRWFEFAKGQLDLSNIDTVRGAWPDWWSDGLGSTPHLDSMIRASMRRLRLLEATGGDRVSNNQIVEDILFAAEHTFGASSSISQPSATTSRRQWEFKNSYAERAFQNSGAGSEDLREWEIPPLISWTEVQRDSCVFETPFYTVRFDANRGDIIELLDREIGVQIVAADALAGFGGLVLETISSPEGRQALWDDDQATTETHHEFWVTNRRKSRIRRGASFMRRTSSLGRIRTASRLAREEITLMECLRRAGYQTYGAGKMHFTPQWKTTVPKDELNIQVDLADAANPQPEPWDFPYYGFESVSLSEDNRMGPYADYLRSRGMDPWGDPHSFTFPQSVCVRSIYPEEHHQTTWITDSSLKFLEGRDVKRPFFLWTSYVHPHHPFDPPEPFDAMYDPKDMPLPVYDPSEVAKWPDAYKAIHMAHEGGHEVIGMNLMTDEQWQLVKAFYYGMISFIDKQVGRQFNSSARCTIRKTEAITTGACDIPGE